MYASVEKRDRVSSLESIEGYLIGQPPSRDKRVNVTRNCRVKQMHLVIQQYHSNPLRVSMVELMYPFLCWSVKESVFLLQVQIPFYKSLRQIQLTRPLIHST